MNMRGWARAALPVATLLLATSACVGRDGGGSGGFRVDEVSGTATVRNAAEETHAIRAGDDVPAGSLIRTAADGFLKMTSGTGTVEIQGDTQIAVAGADRVSLEIGRALGVAGEERTLALDSRGVSVRAAKKSATRLERLLGALRVGVYSGSARVELLGRGVDVVALREVVIAGGVPLERAPRPLTLSATDRWDKQQLGDVLEFDAKLSPFGRGFNVEFAGRAVQPDFFTPFIAVANLGFLRAAVPTSEPSEVLVGLVFAVLLAGGPGGADSVQRSFAELLALREQGASWGLIAKEKGLRLDRLLQAVLDAIRRGTTPAPSGGGGAGGGGGNGGTGGGGSSPSPRQSPRPSPSPSPSPSPTPTNGDECSLLDRLLDPKC